MVALNFTDWSIGARANAHDDGMTCNGLDFSYLGVHGLWQHDLGEIHVNSAFWNHVLITLLRRC
jgi:hypothetical protein